MASDSDSDHIQLHPSWSGLHASTDPTQTLIVGGSVPTSLAEVTRQSTRQDLDIEAGAGASLETGVELTTRISSGQDGTWWEGRQRVFDRPVMIHALTAEADQGRQQAFSRAARIAASLQHPRVVPVHDHDGRHLIMQRVAGVSLRQWRQQHGDDPMTRSRLSTCCWQRSRYCHWRMKPASCIA